MPSITSYTPYESLIFLQSVAQHGATRPALDDISTTLNQNEFIREDATYDSSRLTPSALQGLYQELLDSERNTGKGNINGYTSGASNPRKRKLSASPPSAHIESDQEEQRLAENLVDSLYLQYRERVIETIQGNEEEYGQLQREIGDIQAEIERGSHQGKTNIEGVHENGEDQLLEAETRSNGDALEHRTAQDSGRVKTEPSKAQLESWKAAKGLSSSSVSWSHPLASDTPKATGTEPAALLPNQHDRGYSDATDGPFRSPSEAYSGRKTHPPPLPLMEQAIPRASPSAFPNRTLPPPSPRSTSHGSISPQAGFTGSPHGTPVLPIVPGISPMAPPSDFSGGHRRPSSGHGHGSPAPYHQVPSPHHPAYTQYPPHQPPWLHGPPHQFQPPAPYVNTAYYSPQPGRIHSIPTPTHPQYHHYTHPAPVDRYGNGHFVWQNPSHPTFYHPPGSTISTPAARPPGRHEDVRTTGSSTPWKTPTSVRGGLRLPSPKRPEREVSPLTDRGSPTPISPSRGRTNALLRKTRQDSATPKISRSESVMSNISDATHYQRSTTIRGQRKKIKHEPSGTPVPVASDVESQRSSGHRGRQKNYASQPELPTTHSTLATKRKRSPVSFASASPSVASPALPQIRGQALPSDPNLVAVSKSFVKTANLMLNEITSHRLAGIFAKPLSEREAPGYRQLILKPQDLKSIRTAVGRGNRVAAAAIAEIEEETGQGETSASTKANFVGSGAYMVNKTEELVPPKGIVNSAHLEMELMRLFANAIMFNPLTSSERGFGPDLKPLRRGGKAVAADAGEGETTPGTDTESSESTEDGIIQDTRDMWTGVCKSITDFRSLEDERLQDQLDDQQATHAAAGQRAGSISVSSVMGDEGPGQPEEIEPSVPSTSRKRRRLGDP